jgi:hypothetical protein
MPPSRPSGSSCSSSALRSAAACAAFTSRSHQAARTRSNSKWLICICGGPSTPPEPQPWRKPGHSAAPSDGARPPGLVLREAERHRTRNPRTSNHSPATRSNLPLFPEKTAVADFIRRHKLMEFEKSRLTCQHGEADPRDRAHYARRHRRQRRPSLDVSRWFLPSQARCQE